MNEVRVSIAVERPIEQVWALLGGFDWLPRWLNAIASSTLSDGGRLRHLKTADGAIIIERLLTFDEDQKQYTYALLEGPSPVIDYVGRMSAKVDVQGGTVVCWSSTFLIKDADETEVARNFEDLYREGLEHLKNIIESTN